MLAPDIKQWPVLHEFALYGIAGRVVRAIEPNTEADNAALLLQFLICFGCIAGRNAYFQIEDDKHYSNTNLVIIADTGARKGTGLNRIRALLQRAVALEPEGNPAWMDEHILHGGLSSGEGLIFQVRDPILKRNPKTGVEECVDEGVEDKRLIIAEAEFAGLLIVLERAGNTLSPIIRKTWDNGNLRTMTRQSPIKATDAHIVIIGHITKDEFDGKITRIELANGFANRFLLCVARRSKPMPDGGPQLEEDVADELATAIRQAIDYAQKLKDVRMTRTAAASIIWNENYELLSTRPPGLLGAITGRAAPQVVRLSIIFALLDCKKEIDAPHLLAALATWDYCEQSARYLFGDTLGNTVADTILRALRNSSDGLTRGAIFNDLLGRHTQKEKIDLALGLLLEHGLARHEERRTDGRPAEVWFAVSNVAASTP